VELSLKDLGRNEVPYDIAAAGVNAPQKANLKLKKSQSYVILEYIPNISFYGLMYHD
jgi:hypothetical protein